jgi:hypothetical protein
VSGGGWSGVRVLDGAVRGRGAASPRGIMRAGPRHKRPRGSVREAGTLLLTVDDGWCRWSGAVRNASGGRGVGVVPARRAFGALGPFTTILARRAVPVPILTGATAAATALAASLTVVLATLLALAATATALAALTAALAALCALQVEGGTARGGGADDGRQMSRRGEGEVWMPAPRRRHSEGGGGQRGQARKAAQRTAFARAARRLRPCPAGVVALARRAIVLALWCHAHAVEA